MIAVGFVFAAFVGAAARGFATDPDASLQRQLWGTLGVNVVGAFLLGLLHGSSANTLLIIGVGGLGSLTTFSGVISHVECLGRESSTRDAALYLVGTVVLGILAGWIGRTLA